MSEFTPVDFSRPLEEIIEHMADGHDGARSELESFAQNRVDKRLPLLPTLFDLDDMQMRGEQIDVAVEYCGGDADAFVRACAERSEAMVAYVNSAVPHRTARRHGPQTTLSKVDHAVQAAMPRGNETLERADEGADAVHAFFLSMFTRMQQQRQLVSNYHLNTGMEGIGTITFAITVCEIKDAEGKTMWELGQDKPVAEPSVQ